VNRVKQSMTIWAQSAANRARLPQAVNPAAAAVQRAELLSGICPEVYLVPTDLSARGISVSTGSLQFSDARTAATPMPAQHGVVVANVPGPVPRGRPV
jgi:hypothetical protein